VRGGLLFLLMLWPIVAFTAPSPRAADDSARAAYEVELRAGRPVDVIVEFDHAAADREAHAERVRRQLVHEDPLILNARTARYSTTKRSVEQAALGPDARRLRDFLHLPMSVWRLTSAGALSRVRAHPSVRAVYGIRTVAAVATSPDLALIEQPAAASAGGTGAGTTVVVIDTGIDLTNPAFGTCAGGAGSPGCRVVYYQIDYPNPPPSTTHGTNVSGVVAEVAAAANLAMIEVFNGASASSADVLSAIDWAIGNQATYNIVSANMSLGDGGSYTAATCPTDFNTASSNAAAAGITLVAASGNNAFSGGISWPGCTPGFVSVGAVYDTAISGSVGWGSPLLCTDTNPVVDQVACFTNVGSNLLLLAPGVNVTAAGITESGTSQATPHVTGSVAVLRAKYPRESLSQTQTRLTSTGTIDSASGLSIPRIDLLKALDLATGLALTGSGPTTAQAGASSSYTLTVTNNGPLVATEVTVTDTLPTLATFVSASPGCSASGATVTCQVASLAVNASVSFTITVRWTGSGPVYDTASVNADQINATPTQGSLALGTPPAGVAQADVPLLPTWAAGLLVATLALILRHAPIVSRP
jgi:uncharacterized repeat protein (TIGR01451 family)